LDDSGSIDIDELEVAFRTLGMGTQREILQMVIDEVDDDHSGEIEWPEFLKVMNA
jgi:calmodulin